MGKSATELSLLYTWGWGEGYENKWHYFHTGNKRKWKRDWRKLEAEARSAGEYFHIKKHCFQENDTSITGTGAQNSYQWLWLQYNQGRYGRQRSEITLPGHASRATPHLSSIPKRVLSGFRSLGPWYPDPGSRSAHPRPPDPVPVPGKHVSPSPSPAASPSPPPTQSPAPAPALESWSARPQTDLAEFPHTAARGHNAFVKNLGLFLSLFSYIRWEHSIMTKTSIAQIKHND